MKSNATTKKKTVFQIFFKGGGLQVKHFQRNDNSGLKEF